MSRDLLTQLRGWISSKCVPWFAPYWEAKKLHEGSPHGLFPRDFYHALSSEEILAAERCPRLQRAIELYRECIDRERSAGRVLNEGIALHQLGLVLHRQGKLGAAREAYEKALNILEDLPASEALPAASTCHFRLAEIYLHVGDSPSARLHLEKSQTIDETLNDKVGLEMNAELRRRTDQSMA